MKNTNPSEGPAIVPPGERSLTTPVPPGFSFRRTVLSHGWCSLPPFRFDRERFILHRVVSLPGGRTIAARIEDVPGSRGCLRIAWSGDDLSRREAEALVAQIRRMLRLDENLDEFYRLSERAAGFSWVPACGAGRLLRCPTVFEDLVKLLCTTNCTWSLTEIMVRNLVGALGAPAEGEHPSASRLRTTGAGAGIAWVADDGIPSPSPQRAFPSPEAMASKSERFFETKIRAGYRAAALAALSRKVASGRLDPESWLASELPTEKIKTQILAIRGAGPYTAENLLKLLGRYEGLGLDSWSRAKFARMHPRVGKRRPPSDGEIARYYARFGPWRGLAFWCDLTRDWLEDAQPEGAAARDAKFKA